MTSDLQDATLSTERCMYVPGIVLMLLLHVVSSRVEGHSTAERWTSAARLSLIRWSPSVITFCL